MKGNQPIYPYIFDETVIPKPRDSLCCEDVVFLVVTLSRSASADTEYNINVHFSYDRKRNNFFTKQLFNSIYLSDRLIELWFYFPLFTK